METKSVKKGDLLAKRGGSVDNMWYISDGSVTASDGKLTITLKKGDFIGLCDFDSGIHTFDYTADGPASLMNFSTREYMLESDFAAAKPDNARGIAWSANHYARSVYSVLDAMCLRNQKLCRAAEELYNSYIEFAQTLNSEVKEIEDFGEIATPVYLGGSQKSLMEMHKGIAVLLSDKEKSHELLENKFVPGYMLHCASDFHEAVSSVEYISSTVKDLEDTLINSFGDDLLKRYEDLYLKISIDHPLSSEIKTKIDLIYLLMEDVCPQQIEERKHAFDDKRTRLYNSNDKSGENEGHEDSSSTASKLIGSMEYIFKFASYPDEYADVIREAVRAFKSMSDPFSTEPDAMKLRRTIEDNFYHLYLAVMEAALEKGETPPIISMFLNFGYLDEDLAGINNACALYHLSETYTGNEAEHIFTGYEWLRAIFLREKEPSINEFGQTFAEYIREMADSGRIPQEHINLYLKERGQMVMFELQNMFRRASRMCSGKVSVFCPVLLEKQFLRGPKDEILNIHQIVETRDNFRRIDFSLFYREQVCVFNKKENIHDVIHVEVLPDIVLLPVVGQRGVMWQEVVGKDKMTSARMMLPAFNIEDLEKVMLRMFGEYRWEMCKREMGMRWNDVTSPSLTSLYYDYLQFYRKNSEINAEQKEKIKSGLLKSKNNFKEYFVGDYMLYIKYESKGAPHLTKMARSILFTQCPFSARIRFNLSENPIYTDIAEKYRFQTAKSIHRYENIVKKLNSKGLEIPKELVHEIDFYNS